MPGRGAVRRRWRRRTRAACSATPPLISPLRKHWIADTALGEHGRIEIDIILTAEQHASFIAAMAAGGYRVIDAALAGVRSADATATRPADLAAIRALIESKPGGFAQLDATVKQHLHRCDPDRRCGLARAAVGRVDPEGCDRVHPSSPPCTSL